MKRIGSWIGALSLAPLAASLWATAAWADTTPGNDAGNPAPYGHGHMMWGHGWGGGWGGGWGPGAGWGPGLFFHPFFSLLTLVGLVVVATWIVRLISHGTLRHPHVHAAGEGPGRSRALDILEERFARGEIGREEFEDKRKVIGR